jgi:precorrin-4 methylase
MKRGSILSSLVSALLVATLAACGETEDRELDAMGTIYPLAWVTQAVAGTKADAEPLTPPGVEPHDFELTPKQVVRLKGGDPFVFGRGAEEALALGRAGVECEVVPGVTTAVAAPELAGIPVTHRGVSSAFLVLAGNTGEALERTLAAVRPGSLTLVVMMGLAGREAIVRQLIERGWAADLPAAIVCGASTPMAWTWTGRLDTVSKATPPDGLPGILVVGEVVQVRDALSAALPEAGAAADEVKYGRNR